MDIKITHKNPPDEYKNQNLTYTTIRTNSNFLKVIIEDEGNKIGEGLILDFYKNFRNKGDGTTFAFYESSTFPRSGVYTPYGSFINKIKYGYEEMDDEKKTRILKHISEDITSSKLYKKNSNGTIICIPSSAEIPQELLELLKDTTPLKTEDIIEVNKDAGQAKDNTEDNYEAKLPYLMEKYNIKNLESKKYIILDDVFGTGYSMAYLCSEIYNSTGITPVFFCICKDVKR